MTMNTTFSDIDSEKEPNDARETAQFFPTLLYDMLEDSEKLAFDDIVAWHPRGTSFRVHQPDSFMKTIIPKYFKQQTRYKSFKRQLNLYGFRVAKSGLEKGFFAHEKFIRGQRSLCSFIERAKKRHLTMGPSTATFPPPQRATSPEDSNDARMPLLGNTDHVYPRQLSNVSPTLWPSGGDIASLEAGNLPSVATKSENPNDQTRFASLEAIIPDTDRLSVVPPAKRIDLSMTMPRRHVATEREKLSSPSKLCSTMNANIEQHKQIQTRPGNLQKAKAQLQELHRTISAHDLSPEISEKDIVDEIISTFIRPGGVN